MGFKENLRAELSYQSKLVKELAALTGISKKTIDNYLNARGYSPSVEVAVKIARVLNVSVEYLVSGEELTPIRSSLGPEIQNLIQNYKLLSEEDRQLVVSIIQLLRNRKQTGAEYLIVQGKPTTLKIHPERTKKPGKSC